MDFLHEFIGVFVPGKFVLSLNNSICPPVQQTASPLIMIGLSFGFFRLKSMIISFVFPTFNTIQPQLLAEELLKMKVSIPAILWVLDYLTYRPQFVKSGFELSNIMFTNTGLYCHPLFYFLFIKKKSKKSTVHCRLQEFS